MHHVVLPLPPVLVATAQRQHEAGDGSMSLANISFARDAALPFLWGRATASLDLAVACLELSRLPLAEGAQLLQEMARVATRVVIVDLACDQPWNASGATLQSMLLCQGPAVWAHARAWRHAGGIRPVAAAANMRIVAEAVLRNSGLHVVYMQSFDSFRAQRSQDMVEMAGVD